jgi:serine/threonine protein kinase
MTGRTIAQYEVLERIGAGGMGEIFRARDRRLGREVAIKVLSDEAGQDPDRLRRLVAEAKVISGLNHPNILTLHEIGESDRGPYLVTELVDGQTVRDMLTDGPLPLDQALDIAIQTADGLAKAHEAGIIHRDVKPENLMVTRDRFVKILDFGLAKLSRPEETFLGTQQPQNLTATGMIVGTPAYLSPQRLQGLPTDARSDLFALGVVLYEMLTGTNPFIRKSVAETLHAILSEPLPSLQVRTPGVPDKLAELIRKATAKDPGKGFRDATEMANALRESKANQTSLWATGGAGMAGGKSRRVAWALSIAAGVMITAALGSEVLRTPSSLEQASNSSAPTLSAGWSPGVSVMVPKDRIGVAILPIQDESGDPQLAEASDSTESPGRSGDHSRKRIGIISSGSRLRPRRRRGLSFREPSLASGQSTS